MAITKYLHDNALTAQLSAEFTAETLALQARREKTQKTIVCWSVLPCVLFPPLLPAALAAYYLAGRTGTIDLDPITLAGAAGEHKTLAMLQHLDDRYTILNQVKLPYDKSSTGYREADFVVHGPNGIFVVESKEYSGDLNETGDGADWVSVKTDQRGNVYKKAVKNPVRQVSHYTKLIADALKKQGAESWVEGIVSLTQNNTVVRREAHEIAILPANRITNYIEKFVKRRPHPDSLNVLIEMSAAKKAALPEFRKAPLTKESSMSKDDLLFKNTLKLFGFIGAAVVLLPILFLVAPGLVKSILMLGAIAGFFYLLIKFITIGRDSAACTPCNSDVPNQRLLDDLSAFTRYGETDYVTVDNSWTPED